MKIFAIDIKSGEEEEITDLYWFEENFVHYFSGYAPYTKYKFRFVHDECCENCLWWNEDRKLAEYESPDPLLTHCCERVYYDDSRAMVNKSFGYEDGGDLFTAPDFYCNEWEAKEERG